MTSKQLRILALAVASLLLLAWFGLRLHGQPSPAPQSGGSVIPAQNAEPVAPVATPSPTSAPPSSAAPAVDLFAGAMPDFMAASHVRVLDKKFLESAEQKALYEFGKAHPDDARPQLLLAWDSMNRDWQGMAVRSYRIAYRADRRAKDDPNMLRDLLQVASRFDGVEGNEATEVVKEAYGSDAVPSLDHALDALRAEGDEKRVARLQALRDALSRR